MSTTMIPKKLALLVVKKVLLPGESIRVPVDGSRNMAMIRQHLLSKGSLSSTIIGVIPIEPRTNDDEDNAQYSQLHDIGTVAAVVQITGSNWPQPHYTLLVTGLCRFRLETVIQKNPYFVGQVSPVVQIQADDEDLSSDPELNELVNTFKSKISSLVSMLDVSVPVFAKLKRILDSAPMDTLADTCASIVKTSYSEKLQVLDAIDLAERFKKTLPLLLRQIEGIERLKKASDSETMLTVRRFGKKSFPSPAENDDDDIIELENKIKSAEMPDAVFKVTMKELQRLRKMAPHMPEHATLRTYLEMLAELPWAKSSNQVLDINKARNDLNADHYGMEKVKKRVLEYLAVRQLHNSLKGPILCFVGPPGVGKTSIGRSIANTLAREFHRISLGGVGDPSDIRGHRRTYIGAMPGRIIQGLRSVSVNNPVFLLDEVDKMGSGIHGDPEAALLEVLDPEQNCTFTDHYLNVPFDLSQILFIATANTTSTISPALLDRMEVIPVPGYTHEEKVKIADRHLIQKQIKEHGLNENVLQIPEESIKSIVMNYTREAGVRNLERKLQAICRAVAVKVAENMQLVQHSTGQKSKEKGSEVKELVQFPQLPEMPFVIDDAALKAILGPSLYDKDEISLRLCQPGVAVGLAWTVLGGEIMFVEATTVDGDGQLILTGQLGDVMKESAKLALNWVRSHSEEYGIMAESKRDPMENKDVHIHFPAGAVEKDGPSAGVTIVTVLVSLFSRRCVRSDVAMTGEITLRGLVLPVGGIKEKVLAAHRAGIGTVILPRRNQKDLYDIPSSIQEDMTFVYPEDVDGVLQVAFEGGFPSSHTKLETVLLGKL